MQSKSEKSGVLAGFAGGIGTSGLCGLVAHVATGGGGDALSALASLATLIASSLAAWTAYLAIDGITTWRRQTPYEHNFKLVADAKKALVIAEAEFDYFKNECLHAVAMIDRRENVESEFLKSYQAAIAKISVFAEACALLDAFVEEEGSPWTLRSRGLLTHLVLIQMNAARAITRDFDSGPDSLIFIRGRSDQFFTQARALRVELGKLSREVK